MKLLSFIFSILDEVCLQYSSHSPTKNGWRRGILPAALAFMTNPAFWAGAGKVATTAAGIFGGLKGGGGGDGEGGPGFELPDFELDPFYSQAQETLAPFGKGLLTGDIPDYLKPIGEIGGPEFEDVLGLGIRDIEGAGIRSAARVGQRGGNVPVGIAREVGDFTRKSRFEDLMRALKGREFLATTGANVLSGVRGGALQRTGIESQFALGRGRLGLDYQKFISEQERLKGGIFSNIFESGIKGIGNIIGQFKLGSADTDISNAGGEIGSGFDVAAQQFAGGISTSGTLNPDFRNLNMNFAR